MVSRGSPSTSRPSGRLGDRWPTARCRRAACTRPRITTVNTIGLAIDHHGIHHHQPQAAQDDEHLASINRPGEQQRRTGRAEQRRDEPAICQARSAAGPQRDRPFRRDQRAEHAGDHQRAVQAGQPCLNHREVPSKPDETSVQRAGQQRQDQQHRQAERKCFPPHEPLRSSYPQPWRYARAIPLGLLADSPRRTRRGARTGTGSTAAWGRDR